MNTADWLDRIAPCVRLTQGAERLTYTGHFRNRPNWIEPLRVIYDHQVLIISEGEFIVEVEGRRYPCRKGTFMVIPPGHWHVSWETAGRFGHRHWSHFDWVFQGPHGKTPIMTFAPEKPLEHFYRKAPEYVPNRVLHGVIPRYQRVMEISERLDALANSGQSRGRLIARSVLLELLLELCDESAALDGAPPPELRLAERARHLLDSNLEKHAMLRIENLLEETGFSYAHVCRLFKKRYGMPPLKYLHLLSISRAKLMLRDTDLPIRTIASRLAFADPEYFSQVFRRNAGQSPTEYRRAIR